MSETEVSIVVPTYNERDNIAELVDRIHKALSRAGIKYEIVIVDDNSPDGTAEVAESLSSQYNVKVLKRKGKLGLSSAVLDGVKISTGRYIVVMDADLQHPPEVIPELTDKARNGYDVVIASRYVRGGSPGEWNIVRKVISKGATYIARIMLPQARNVKDPMSGFFLFKKEVIEDRQLNPRGFKILLELLVRGRYNKVCEVPYTFGKRLKGKSKLGTKEIINYLLHVMDLTPRYMKFAMVGAVGTIVNLSVLASLRYLMGLSHAVSSAAGIEVSVISNFILNDMWTFKREREGSRIVRLLKFHLSSAAGITTQFIVSLAVFEFLLKESIIAQLIGIFAGFVINYLISKSFVWRTKS